MLAADTAGQNNTHAAEPSSKALTLREQLAVHERKIIADALLEHGFNMAATARALGISRPALYDRVEKLDVRSAFSTQRLGG